MTATEDGDMRKVELAVRFARYDIYHHRQPNPAYEDIAHAEWGPLAYPLLDPVNEDAKAEIMELAEKFGLVDQNAGEFDSLVLGLLIDVSYRAFWLGLTEGHVKVCDDAAMPRWVWGYELVPGAQLRAHRNLPHAAASGSF